MLGYFVNISRIVVEVLVLGSISMLVVVGRIR